MIRELLAEALDLLRSLNRKTPSRATAMRLQQGADALLPISVAAELLGGPGKREWILRNVVIRNVAGDARVKWGDVLAATETGIPQDDDTTPNRPRLAGTLRRGIAR